MLATIYYAKHTLNKSKLTTGDIKALLISAVLPNARKINVTDVLIKSVPYVESIHDGAGKFWQLTKSGEKKVKEILLLPQDETEIENEAGSLESIIQSIADPVVRAYLEEALKCLKVNALRAAVVFLWAGAISEIQKSLLSKTKKDLNIAIQKHDPKARTVNLTDHFAFIKESTQLLAARDLGIIDKGEHATLESALDLRNRCGHPGKYSPGIKKVASFIEDLVGIVF